MASGNRASMREGPLIIAAVVGETQRIGVGHGGGGHEVAPPELDAIEAVAPRRQIDQPLDLSYRSQKI